MPGLNLETRIQSGERQLIEVNCCRDMQHYAGCIIAFTNTRPVPGITPVVLFGLVSSQKSLLENGKMGYRIDPIIKRRTLKEISREIENYNKGHRTKSTSDQTQGSLWIRHATAEEFETLRRNARAGRAHFQYNHGYFHEPTKGPVPF